MSMEEFDKIIPVNPPIVNRNTNPIAHMIGVDIFMFDEANDVVQLKILIPVGIAMIIVADVK